MPYKDFSELVLHKERDRDFGITIIDQSAQLTFAAIHGGNIEPLTECIARFAAGDKYSFYAFSNVDSTDAQDMRVPVSRFNELRLKNLMERSRTTIHIDGNQQDAAHVGLASPDQDLEQSMIESLTEAGFQVGSIANPADVYGGYQFFSYGDDANIQIELPQTLRRSLTNGDLESAAGPCIQLLNEQGKALANALAVGARTYLKRRDMDLNRTMTWFDETTERVKKTVFKNGIPEQHHH